MSATLSEQRDAEYVPNSLVRQTGDGYSLTHSRLCWFLSAAEASRAESTACLAVGTVLVSIVTAAPIRRNASAQRGCRGPPSKSSFVGMTIARI